MQKCHRSLLPGIERVRGVRQVQQMWTSLESVFTGGDIAKQMPMEERSWWPPWWPTSTVDGVRTRR